MTRHVSSYVAQLVTPSKTQEHTVTAAPMQPFRHSRIEYIILALQNYPLVGRTLRGVTIGIGTQVMTEVSAAYAKAIIIAHGKPAKNLYKEQKYPLRLPSVRSVEPLYFNLLQVFALSRNMMLLRT